MPVSEPVIAGGDFGLDVSLPVDENATQVAYAVTRAGVALRAGIIQVSEGRARLLLGSLPPGQDYTISVHTEGSDRAACDGEAKFDIKSGDVTNVTLTMRCGGAAQQAAVSSPSSMTPASMASTPNSTPNYLVPLTPGVNAKPLVSVGDAAKSAAGAIFPDYRMAGSPAALGAFDNDDGTLTLLASHNFAGSSGAVRAHGATGSFVSHWLVRKSDRALLSGDDLIRTIDVWNPSSASYVVSPALALARLSGGDLPAVSALWHIAAATGFRGHLYLSGEASGHDGRAFAHGLDGVSYALPALGKASWANLILNPFSQAKTVLVALDGSSLGHAYIYVGTKSNDGTPVDRAGLTGGSLYGIAISGVAREPEAGIANAPFSLVAIAGAQAMSGVELDATSAALSVSYFNGLADGAWDPANVGDFYFISSGAPSVPSRLWRLRFTDITRPELGGSLQMLLDGSEGHAALASLASDGRGHLLLEDDPGNQPRLAQIYRYSTASDVLVPIAQHNAVLFSAGTSAFISQDERATGVIDATSLFGPGYWLTSEQVHLPTQGEGGQISLLYDPGTL